MTMDRITNEELDDYMIECKNNGVNLVSLENIHDNFGSRFSYRKTLRRMLRLEKEGIVKVIRDFPEESISETSCNFSFELLNTK